MQSSQLKKSPRHSLQAAATTRPQLAETLRFRPHPSLYSAVTTSYSRMVRSRSRLRRSESRDRRAGAQSCVQRSAMLPAQAGTRIARSQIDPASGGKTIARTVGALLPRRGMHRSSRSDNGCHRLHKFIWYSGDPPINWDRQPLSSTTHCSPNNWSH